MSQHISNLPVGARVKFGRHSINGEAAQDITWLVVAKNHTGYRSDTVTLFTEKVIDIRSFDAREPNSEDEECQSSGNNRYYDSNIRYWLNSYANAGEVAWRPFYDEQAPTDNYCKGKAGYAHLPGFLNPFTADERSLISSTEIREWTDNGFTDSMYDNVFIPNPTELGVTSGNTISSGEYEEKGETWELFAQGRSRIATATEQVKTYSTTTLWATIGGKENTSIMWMTRACDDNDHCNIWYVDTLGRFSKNYLAYQNCGLRPALNLSSTAYITDTTDGDGCYIVLTGAAPASPSPLSVPTVMSGRATTISWGAVADPYGGAVTYELQCSIDGGEYSTLYRGASLAYTHVVEVSTGTVQYRVRATGSNGIDSDYTVSNLIYVIHNTSPVISGTDKNFGTLNDGISVDYVVTDAEESGSTISVTESVDGVAVRTHDATLGQKYTFAIAGEEWLKVSNGSHTVTITAVDSFGSTSHRNYTFTKSVTSLCIQTRPMEASAMPTQLALSVTRSVPTGAIFKVEVCNNGNDASPVWEDATIAVERNLVYSFTNVSKTSDKWGVMVKVTLDRNGSSGACYVSAIGGNFE